MLRALFSQFSCAFKALQAKEQVLMQKLTQAEVKQHQNLQHQYLTLNSLYLNSLHSTAAAEVSATAFAKPDLAAFAEALVDVERLGRLKLPNALDIISKYPLIVQPVSRIISCLPCAQVSVERMFSHLKLVLRENRVQMGTELTDAIVFMRTNKFV